MRMKLTHEYDTGWSISVENVPDKKTDCYVRVTLTGDTDPKGKFYISTEQARELGKSLTNVADHVEEGNQ